MKKFALFTALLVLMISSCEKNDQPNEEDENTSSDIPQKLTISFYSNNGELFEKLIYEPDKQSTLHKTIINWTDSAYEFPPGATGFYHAKTTLEYDPGTNLLTKINSRNYRSGRVWNTGTLFEVFESEVNNYSATIVKQPHSPEHFELNFIINRYNDSLQQNKYFSDNFIASVNVEAQGSFTAITSPHFGDPNFWTITKDSIYLLETTKNYAPHHSHRYFNFFNSLKLWYRTQPLNLSLYRIKSPFVCDSLILQNGNFQFFPDGRNPVFKSALDRKIVYKYSADTTAIKSFIGLVNPIYKEPLWFFISEYGQAFTNSIIREEGNYTDLYNWMSKEYSDSVFVVDVNGKRMLQSTATTRNTVEKDSRNRIIKIINRTDNQNFYKVMELTY